MFMLFKTMGLDEITQESAERENTSWGQSSLQTLSVKDWAEEEARDIRVTKSKQGVSGIMKAAGESISKRKGDRCAQSC